MRKVTEAKAMEASRESKWRSQQHSRELSNNLCTVLFDVMSDDFENDKD